MFSLVERATTRTFVRVLVIVLAAVLLCGLFSVTAIAAKADRRPCELPGDGEDVGGYKSYEFEGSPTSGLIQQPGTPLREYPERETTAICVKCVAALIQFYLTCRR